MQEIGDDQVYVGPGGRRGLGPPREGRAVSAPNLITVLADYGLLPLAERQLFWRVLAGPGRHAGPAARRARAERRWAAVDALVRRGRLDTRRRGAWAVVRDLLVREHTELALSRALPAGATLGDVGPGWFNRHLITTRALARGWHRWRREQARTGSPRPEN
jgi:hypothetical protein